MKVKIKYHDEKVKEAMIAAAKRKDMTGKANEWIDLCAAKSVHIPAGGYYNIPLGISVELPAGYEAHIIPRSSTFRRYGIILTNSMGVIDNSYNGPDDIWGFPAYSITGSRIEKGERIAQFRIMPAQIGVELVEDDLNGNDNRGGFGSTGR